MEVAPRSVPYQLVPLRSANPPDTKETVGLEADN